MNVLNTNFYNFWFLYDSCFAYHYGFHSIFYERPTSCINSYFYLFAWLEPFYASLLFSVYFHFIDNSIFVTKHFQFVGSVSLSLLVYNIEVSNSLSNFVHFSLFVQFNIKSFY